jgi:hypothetical protein
LRELTSWWNGGEHPATAAWPDRRRSCLWRSFLHQTAQKNLEGGGLNQRFARGQSIDCRRILPSVAAALIWALLSYVQQLKIIY